MGPTVCCSSFKRKLHYFDLLRICCTTNPQHFDMSSDLWSTQQVRRRVGPSRRRTCCVDHKLYSKSTINRSKGVCALEHGGEGGRSSARPGAVDAATAAEDTQERPSEFIVEDGIQDRIDGRIWVAEPEEEGVQWSWDRAGSRRPSCVVQGPKCSEVRNFRAPARNNLRAEERNTWSREQLTWNRWRETHNVKTGQDNKCWSWDRAGCRQKLVLAADWIVTMELDGQEWRQDRVVGYFITIIINEYISSFSPFSNQ